MIDPSVFRAYDVRGVYPDGITEELAYMVGRAMVTFLGAKALVVGMDMRHSSPALAEHLIKGITEQGADVISIGQCTTPLLSWTVAHYGYDGGVMISASHNPGHYNAFKLIKKPMLQIGADSGMEQVKKLVLDNTFVSPQKKGRSKQKKVLPDYLDHVKRFAKSGGLKLVMDYGNGMGAVTATPFFGSTDHELVELYPEPDGAFPHHPANPHDVENFADLQERVRKEKADLGVFFDGDADRALFVDERGELVPPDLGFCLLALEELKQHPGETVYYDLRFSKIVKEKIVEAGGKPVMEKVGNPIYKEKLVKEGGVLGGELSGHVMFKDNHAIDDGLFCTIKLLNLVWRAKQEGVTVSQLIQPLQTYCTHPEMSFKVENNEEKQRKLDQLKTAFAKKGCTLSTLDGVTAEGEAYWFNVRPSNTEPILRVRLEADTADLLEKVKKDVLAIVQSA